MPYARRHHRDIAAVLGVLDAGYLRARHCYFGGGTALALMFDEYRESVDIGLLVAGKDDYRELSNACRSQGLAAITLPGQRVATAEDFSIDRYGIRTWLDVSGVRIKFEIVHEGRIELDEPGTRDTVLGVTTATLADLVATKLLANCDRWTDPSVYSRDIIDLAMVAAPRPVLQAGMRKARAEYRDAVYDKAQAAVIALLERGGAIDACRKALDMQLPTGVIGDRLRRLSTSLKRAWGTLPPP